jgi:hypothetical protein
MRTTKNPHLTPLCPGIGEAGLPVRDRIVSPGRMDWGAFILFKAARVGPKTAKQAEIRLADLLKILRIAGSEGQNRSRGRKGCARASFRRIWLICPKSAVLLSRSQFGRRYWRSIRQGDAG